MGVPVDVRPWILLNEYPSRGAVENSVFISPEPDKGYEVKVRGKRIIVRFKEDLPVNRTVLITFGSGIQDVRGNQMAESFVLAFSTGEMIDRAGIEGRVVGMENPAATWIWGYPLDSFDESDPRQDRAPFATQPDLVGYFTLSFLPSGQYRIFAVTDSRRNRLWDSDKEPIAFPPDDIQAEDINPPIVNLKLGMCDMVPPTLRGAQALHRQAIRLSFDEPVDISEAHIGAETAGGRTLAVIDLYQNRADCTSVLLTTAVQRQGDVYQLRLDGIKDFSENRTDSIVCRVDASILVDSTGPHFAWSDPKDGDTEIEPGKAIQVGFSEAVILTDLPRAVSLWGPDRAAAEGQWSYNASSWSTFQPTEPLGSHAQYTIRVLGDSLRDIFGNPSPDSLVEVSFTTLNLEEVGAITGSIVQAAGDLRLVAERLGSAGGTWEISVGKEVQYRLDNLPTANYRLWLYRDRDGNGRFSPGRYQPFRFAEPFEVRDDTIRVRSRWETEGVNLTWGEDETDDRDRESE